jgi:hypothetical protein
MPTEAEALLMPFAVCLGSGEKGTKEKPEPSFVSEKIGPKRQAELASKVTHPPAG